MQRLSLRQAAKESKRGKTTILEAIQSGRLSATRNDLNQWQIDPAELFRVYPPDQTPSESEGQDRPDKNPPDHAALVEKIKGLEAQLDREREITRRLFDQLDEAGEERRRLTALLTHQPEAKAEPAATTATNQNETASDPIKPQSSFFAWAFGKAKETA